MKRGCRFRSGSRVPLFQSSVLFFAPEPAPALLFLLGGVGGDQGQSQDRALTAGRM